MDAGIEKEEDRAIHRVITRQRQHNDVREGRYWSGYIGHDFIAHQATDSSLSATRKDRMSRSP